MGAADDHFRYAFVARKIDDRFDYVVGLEPHGLGAEIARKIDVVEQRDEIAGADIFHRLGRRFDMDRIPFGIELAGDPGCAAEQLAGITRVGGETDHYSIDHVRAPAAIALERLLA